MLVLSRKVGESIVIGDDVMLTILDVRGGHIRLGFDAPLSIPICREELLREDVDQRHEVREPDRRAAVARRP